MIKITETQVHMISKYTNKFVNDHIFLIITDHVMNLQANHSIKFVNNYRKSRLN